MSLSAEAVTPTLAAGADVGATECLAVHTAAGEEVKPDLTGQGVCAAHCHQQGHVTVLHDHCSQCQVSRCLPEKYV